MASSLDANQQAADQVLLGQLNYKLPSTASYILDRRAVSFFTNSAGTYSPTGVWTFRIQLNSDHAWADLNTLSLSFTIKNTAGANTRLMNKCHGPWSLIQRMRVSVSGTVVEDLQYYGRLHEQFYQLSSSDMQRTEATRGFLARGRYGARFTRAKIAGGQTYTVAMKPLSGLLQCGRFFPIAWCPIVIECELAPADVSWVSGPTLTPGDGLTYTQQYELSDARINVDLCTLDSSMHEEFSKLMENGGSLPLTITSFAHFNQAILGANPVVSLTRACSRIRDVLWSFTRRRIAGNIPITEVAIDPDLPDPLPPNTQIDQVVSWVNDFFYPKRSDVDVNDATDACLYEAQWWLGAKSLGPEQTFRYTHEYLQELYKALGYLNDTKALPDLDRYHYLTECHMGGVTLERALNVAMTGLSSRSGSLLSVQFPGARGDSRRLASCRRTKSGS